MKLAIHEILNMTLEKYQDECFERYMRWCMDNSISPNDLQKLMANRIVNSYYNTEFAKLENNFITAVLPIYKSLQKPQIDKIYTTIVCEIFTLKSPPLFALARKTNIINQLN